MIRNKTKNTILAKKVKFCRSAFSKFKGLMFSRCIKNTALIFIFDEEKKTSLHMFFVFFPIDVLFLDNSKRVVEIKENFRPFRIYFPSERVKYVIELPNNSVNKTRTKINDEIVF